MSDQDSLLPRLQSLHDELEVRVADSTKDELGQCARLLAMYLALYKRKYGELAAGDCQTPGRRDEDKVSGAEVFALGMAELNEMLHLVATSGHEECSYPPHSSAIN